MADAHLSIGYNTRQQINWFFQLTGSSSTNLHRLKIFCDFHLKGKRVFIDTIYIPVYYKEYDIIVKNYEKEWGLIYDRTTRRVNWQYDACIDSYIRVAKSLKKKYLQLRKVPDDFIVKLVKRLKVMQYGSVSGSVKGTKGYSRVVYLNKSETGLLSEDKMEIIERIKMESYKKVTEQRFKIDEALAIRELNVSQWREAMSKVNTVQAYNEFQKKVKEELGFLPAKRIQLFRYKKAEGI